MNKKFIEKIESLVAVHLASAKSKDPHYDVGKAEAGIALLVQASGFNPEFIQKVESLVVTDFETPCFEQELLRTLSVNGYHILQWGLIVRGWEQGGKWFEEVEEDPELECIDSLLTRLGVQVVPASISQEECLTELASLEAALDDETFEDELDNDEC